MYGAFVLCILACLVHIISCTCIGGLNPGYGPSLGHHHHHHYHSTIAPPPAASLAASNGGGFSVTSTSPIVPTGLAVLSENLSIDGGVAVGGHLPFLGTVATDGVFPTTGSGIISYGCGDGTIGILPESPVAPMAPMSSGLGYRGYKPCGLY